MPHSDSTPPQQQDIEGDIAKSVNLLAEAITFAGIKIPDKLRLRVLDECVAHHGIHIKRLGVNQIKVDPYKVITWFGFFLAENFKGNDKCRGIVKATIRTLNYALSSEEPLGGLAANTLSYMEDFVVNEINDAPDCGIGKNGLFLAFHTASVMKRRAQRSFNQGWSATRPAR